MKTNLFLIAVLFRIPLYATDAGVTNETTSGKGYDTIIIKEIKKELYVCTCKPTTSNPSGYGQLFFQGKYKQNLVTKDLDYRDCDERFLILWDLSELPAGVEIIEAKMELY
jgi:hypothetical protein